MQMTSSTPVRSAVYLSVGLLTLTNFMSYTDRMLLPALMQPIKLEFSLSDTELGVLSGLVFALVYAFSGIPISRLADRSSRRLILAASLAFWSLMTAACGIARTFGQLAAARIGVGIGESGCAPTSMSLLSDYFPPERRGTAVAFVGVGNTLGIAAGLSLGGWLGEALGWRGAFIAVGLPGLLLAVALFLFVREEPRPAHASAQSSLGIIAAMSVLLSNRSYRWLLAGSVSHTFITYGVVQWLPSFFMRTHDLGLKAAGVWTGAVIGCGMAIGTLAGGVLGDRLSKRGLERPQYLCVYALLALMVVYGAALWAPTAPMALGFAFVGAALAAVTISPTLTAILNVTHPGLRATGTALNILAISLLGVGLAPVVVGFLSDRWQPSLGDDSLRYALTLSLIMGLVGAVLHRRAAIAMREDGFSASSADLPVPAALSAVPR